MCGGRGRGRCGVVSGWMRRGRLRLRGHHLHVHGGLLLFLPGQLLPAESRFLDGAQGEGFFLAAILIALLGFRFLLLQLQLLRFELLALPLVLLQPYCGADLNDDLRNQVGFQHSRYWLSKQLCVPEHAVNEVIRDNLLVPHSWLLKLAELGANVPGLVRVTLYLNNSRGQLAEPEPARHSAFNNKNGFGSVPSFSEEPAQDAKQAPQKAETHGQLGHDSRPLESVGPEHVARAPFSGVSSLADSKVTAQAPITASARREQSSIHMNWTEDDGLHFSVSAALLEKIPDGLVDLLNLMTHSGLLGPLPGPGTRASRT